MSTRRRREAGDRCPGKRRRGERTLIGNDGGGDGVLGGVRRGGLHLVARERRLSGGDWAELAGVDAGNGDPVEREAAEVELVDLFLLLQVFLTRRHITPYN